jgi:hypothetical protein
MSGLFHIVISFQHDSLLIRSIHFVLQDTTFADLEKYNRARLGLSLPQGPVEWRQTHYDPEQSDTLQK